MRAGDWTCPGCGANVFATKVRVRVRIRVRVGTLTLTLTLTLTKNHCFKCATPRPT